MVKRNAYTAIVSLSSAGHLVKGEWVDSAPSILEVKGHYDPVNNSRVVIKSNSLGNEKEVHGEFFTHSKVPTDNPTHLLIKDIGIDVDIITWEQYQSHSIIYV
jgi:hypothetical protein